MNLQRSASPRPCQVIFRNNSVDLGAPRKSRAQHGDVTDSQKDGRLNVRSSSLKAHAE